MRSIAGRWLRIPFVIISVIFFSMPARVTAQNRQTGQGTKPIIRVATIGHQDHGKTTLAAAITKILSAKGKAEYRPYKELSKPPKSKIQGVTIEAVEVEYETDKARYIHTDCRGPSDYEKLLKSGEVQLDGVIIVVAANDGPMPQTREQIYLALDKGIKRFVIYLNKVDLTDDPELVQLVELEVRDILNRDGSGSLGADAQAIRGSALMALNGTSPKIGKDSITELLAAMDKAFVKGRKAPAR